MHTDLDETVHGLRPTGRRLSTSILLVALLAPSVMIPSVQYLRRGIFPEGSSSTSAPLSWQMYSLIGGSSSHTIEFADGTSLRVDVHAEFPRIERRIQYGTYLLEKLCERYPDAVQVTRGGPERPWVHRC